MKRFLIKLFLPLYLFISLTVNAQPLHFALLSAQDSPDPFWGIVETVAQHAAQQFDIKLSIFHTNNSKRTMLKILNNIKDHNVDALIFPNYGQIGLQLLKDAEQLKIPTLLFNSDFSKNNKPLAGLPQQKFKYWLASLMISRRATY